MLIHNHTTKVRNMLFYVEDERDTTQMLLWDKVTETNMSNWRSSDSTKAASTVDVDYMSPYDEKLSDFFENHLDEYENTIDYEEPEESQDYEDFEVNAELLQAHDFAYS
jgi:O6-methylguanine-DNA--protein-cysteine methyltransferase